MDLQPQDWNGPLIMFNTFFVFSTMFKPILQIFPKALITTFHQGLPTGNVFHGGQRIVDGLTDLFSCGFLPLKEETT